MSSDDVTPELASGFGLSASDKVRRRLAVILASDIAGYSRLVAADEEGTILRFTSIAERFREIVGGHDGRVFNTAGDAVLAEFRSAVDAVRCALDVHEATASLCKDLAPDRQLEFRIGIAVGDVIVASNGDLLGDGVNIAARLQALAVAGGICVSDEVRSHVQAKVELGFQDLGYCDLKNFPQPVRAFLVGAKNVVTARPQCRFPRRYGLVGGTVSLIAVGLAAALIHVRSAAPPLHPSVAGDVPFVNDQTRRMLGDHYGPAPLHKALALSPGSTGFAVGQPSREQAAAVALNQRALKPGECDVYASDDDVVWTRPSPMLPLQDVRADGAEIYRADSLPVPIPSESHFFRELPRTRLLKP